MNTDPSLPPQDNQEKASDVQKNKDTAAASYFMILAPLLLYTRKDSDFVVHHAQQGVVLFVGFVLFWVLGEVLSLFSWFLIPILGLCVWGFVNAFSGRWYTIPGVYDLSKNGISVQGIYKAGLVAKDFVMEASKGVALGVKSVEYVPMTKRVEELEAFGGTEYSSVDFVLIAHYSDEQKKLMKEYIAGKNIHAVPLKTLYRFAPKKNKEVCEYGGVCVDTGSILLVKKGDNNSIPKK